MTPPTARILIGMLRNIDIPDGALTSPIPPNVRRLLDEADSRIDDFLHHRRGPLIENFVASDFRSVFSAIRWIVNSQLNAGHMFCEWGSGFGVVTMLASLEGFNAVGVEVEQELVDCATDLANDLEIPAEFSCGSFIPTGGHDLIQYDEDVAHIETDSPSGYEGLDLDISDFDLFFAFPWPGETQFWDAIFHHYAAEGSLLLTYHGIEDLKLQRKVRG